MFKNTVKTTALLGGLGSLIVFISSLFGRSALPIGLGLALIMVGGSYWFSDKLAIRSAKAQIIQRSDAPEYYDIVATLAQRAGMPMPKVAISPSEQPNAFATGRGPRNAVVCATVGLLREMPRDEVEAVMAHELMHVKHRDILIGSVAAAIATGISFIANMAMYASMFGGNRDDEDRPNPLALLAVSLVAPIAASLLQMAVSRSREFEADRGAKELLGTGTTLAQALRRIEHLATGRPMNINPAQASAYIHNPLAGRRNNGGPNMARLFSTHPSTDDRIAALLS